MRRQIIIILIAILCLTGCNNSNQSDGEALNDIGDDKVYDGNYAAVYDITKSFNGNSYIQYQYFVFNKDKTDVIDYGVTYRVEPDFVQVSDDVLKVIVSGGTNVEMVTYYNLEQTAKSDTYENVLTEFESDVAYVEFDDDKCSVVVKDIFSGETVDTFELDLADAVVATAGSFSAEFDNDTRQLSVTHPAGEDYEDIIEVFEIR